MLHFQIFLKVLVLFALTRGPVCFALDDTLVSGKSGKDVVVAVEHIIQKSDIFKEDDHRFFIRTAWVENKFANPVASGGIWKLTSQAFTITQSPGTYPVLKDLHNLVQEKFGIDWMTVTMAQLGIPLYSGLAFLLLLQTKNNEIPFTVNAQAEYWKLNYNFEAGTTPSTFVNAVTELEKLPTCHGKLDLVIVLDGSGSTADYFESTKEVILGLLNSFTLGSVRIGLVLYGGSNFTESYPLSTDRAEIVSQIQDMVNEAGENYIGEGINAAVDILTASTSRQGAPHVMAIFTDGGGNQSQIIEAVERAEESKITTYVLAIGNYSSPENQDNLLAAAGGDNERLFELTDDRDGALDEVMFQLNEQLCGVSQHREIQVGDELSAGETRYYNFEMFKATGLTLVANVQVGGLVGYWSDTIQNPSSAFYNGTWTLSTASSYVVPANVVGEEESKTIYVGVTGTVAVNKYTLLGIATTCKLKCHDMNNERSYTYITLNNGN